MYPITAKDRSNTQSIRPLATWLQLLLASTLGLALFLLMLGALTTPNVWAADFTVTKLDDTNGTCTGGDCSLREAISAANASGTDDTITLPSGVYTLTLTGANENSNATGDLDITAANALTITGAGAEQTIINANDIDRVFELRPGAGTVVISGVTIYNGSSNNGGGIYNQDADLTLINTRVVSNSASNEGGGLFVVSGDVTLTGTQIISNSASQNGGGLYVWSANVMLNGGEVNGNSTGGTGGGLSVLSDATLTMAGTQVFSNSANVGGGGLEVYGSVTLTGARVLSNSAGFFGGGLELAGTPFSRSILTATHTLILYNSATYGGGLAIQAYGTAFLSDTQVLGNNSADSGGGLYVEGSVILNDGAVNSNSASNQGGGLVSWGSATLTGTQVISNSADYGGGLAVFGSTTLTGTWVLSNSANIEGGGLYGQVITTTNGCIAGNSDIAVIPSSGTLSAQDIWWGAANGPDGAGPGSGDTVTSSVDYANFKTVAPAGCPTLPPQAEIYVLGQGQIIPSANIIPATPSTANDTDFGSNWTTPVTHTFTISSSSSDALDLNLSGASLQYGVAFTLTQPSSPVSSGSSTPLEVIFNPTATGQFTDTVLIDTNDPDEAPYTFVISGTGVAYDLAVNKTAAATIDGSFTDNTTTITYTISVHNLNGGDDVTGVVISDTLPVSVTLVTSNTTNGSNYNSATGQWNVGSINTGSGVTMTLVVTGHNLVGQQIVNRAELTPPSPTDVITGNNSASVTVQPSLYYFPIIFKNSTP